MTVLRSRDVGSTPESPVLLKKRKNEVLEPSTPAKSDALSNLPVDTIPHSGSSRKRSAPPGALRRRSLRLAAKSCTIGIGEDIENLIQEGSNAFSDITTASNRCNLESSTSYVIEKEAIPRKSQPMEVDTVKHEPQTQGDTSKKFFSLSSGEKTKSEVRLESGGSLSVSGGLEGDHRLFPGKESEVVSNGSGSVAASLTNSGLNASRDVNGNIKSKRLTIEDKGKGKVSEVYFSNENRDVIGVNTMRRLSREEKGKEAMIGNDLSQDFCTLDMDSGSKVEPSETAEREATQHEEQVMEPTVNVTDTNRGYSKQFKIIAKQNASRFAHFSSLEEDNLIIGEASREIRETQPMQEVEDWPGPFSTAMKIIQDRVRNMSIQTPNGSIPKSKATSLVWTPKRDAHSNSREKMAPSLQDLCMSILVKNADAITSLDCIPDVLRHKLCHRLCDSRKMNDHFLGLLTCGSPTEIRLRDCSWLSEEDFIKSFEGCRISNLVVLQLDQCGRCLPDFTLLATLARLPNSLPALTTISLKGACRLSDSGLSALVSAAPSLRSINLSQCSLLTFDGIKRLSNSLGSVLKELYLDDCQSIDTVLVLPFLLKLEHLEVLSVAGIHTICDDFVIQLVSQRGHNSRELILKDCMKLTDCSVKAIAESCPGLCAIDLSNLCKLTDSSLAYLANGCIAVQKLTLCRNAFSDEAVAAYLENCGNSLKELSLNNVSKVSQNTAMSLAKCCINLQSLDLSWCRKLTDEALGLIADSCLSLEILKLFGCTQVTNVFLEGHSNPQVKIIGLKMTPVLEHMKAPDCLQGPLLYSSA